MGLLVGRRRWSSRLLAVIALVTLEVVTLVVAAHAQPANTDLLLGEEAAAQAADQTSNKVTLPKLVYKHPADYPATAEAERLEADVPLILTVASDGTVKDVSVVEAVGHGFDEAAVLAVKQFVFTPALKAGRAVESRIRYLFAFRLPVEGAEVKTADAASPAAGQLAATVRLRDDDVPLAGAEILITSQTGEQSRTTTNARGESQFDLPPGQYRVQIRAAGFDELVADEVVRSGEVTSLVYRLEPTTTGIVIEVTGRRPPREVTHRALERREIERIPGTSGDALRSLESLPGVARPPGLLGQLVVRGSAPEDTVPFVNGTDVPFIYHFGGIRSVIPTELLDRIDFYPGNFSARYGRANGGIIDVALRRPDVHCSADYGKASPETGCYHGLVQVDLLDGRVLFQGPIGSSKTWSFAAGGRRSWLDVWLKPLLTDLGAAVTTAPVYSDYQLIVDHALRRGRLSFRFFGSSDRLELIVRDPNASDPGLFGGNIRFYTAFYRGQILYSNQLSDAVELRSMVSVGRNQVDFGIAQARFHLDFVPVSARSEFGFELSRKLRLNTGLDFQSGPADVLVRAPEPPRPGESPPGPFTTRQFLETSDEATLWRPAWYAEAEYQPHPRLLIVPGLRADFTADTGHADLSPRVNARYTLFGTDTHRPKSFAGGDRKESRAGDGTGQDTERLRTTLKGGVGLFHQPPTFQETDEVFGTPNLKSNRAVHYSLGVEQDLSAQVELSVEGFYKDLATLVSREPSLSGNFVYNNDGRGKVIGMETLLRYKPDQRFFGWLAYTLSRSTRQDSPSGDEYLFQFDQTHILTMLGSYRLGRGWEFGARFRVVSGPLDSPVNSTLPSVYAADAAAYTPILDSPFSRRLPVFHQADLRIDKTWQFRTWKLSAFLDVLNAYNNPAAEAVGYNFDFSQQTINTGLPILPSLGLRGDF